MPTPEQIQAAMPAMREWLIADATKGRHLDDPRRTVEGAPDWSCAGAVEAIYPGGVAQFIQDQEEEAEQFVYRVVGIDLEDGEAKRGGDA